MNKHRIFHLITLIVMILLFTIPTHAQEATQEATVEALPVVIVGGDSVDAIPSNSVPTPVVIGGAVILGIVILGLMYNQNQVLKIIAPLIPIDSATALITAALPSAMDIVMNNVAKAIPGPIDDALFIEAAKQRGLTVVRDDISGVYHTARTTAPGTTIASAPPNYTTTPTQNITDVYGQAGADTGAAAFPKP